MSIAIVREYLKQFEASERILEFPVSSATVELAAEAVGCQPARITKTLSFKLGEGCILVAAAGDAKIDNAKYKQRFGAKAKMLDPEEVASVIEFLASEKASFLTGEIIQINGGQAFI